MDTMKDTKMQPATDAVSEELRNRLEAAEKDVAIKEEVIDSLAAVVKRLDAQCDAAEKERDDVAQQLVQSERGKRAISEECDALRNEIAYVKEVEFPRKAQAVADAWKGKCKRLEVERDALRAKTTEMEKQEPVAWMHETRRDSDVVTDAVKHVWGKVAVGSMAAYSIPLYALPGAKGGVEMIDITGLRKDKRPQSSTIVHALLDRLEAAESKKAAYKKAFEISENTTRDLTEKVIPNLREQLEAVEKERDALRTALEKIADWDSAWGPYPETNKAWCAMAIVTAREAVPQPGETT